MPKVNFPTIGDIEDYEFLQGTIKTIDSSTDTCTVEVDGSVISALLFYHCLPDSQLRDNGAIEGSAAGFAEEDSVIVQLKYDRSVARIVAHVDGVRKCGFQFKLTRDIDGAILNTTSLLRGIYFYNSLGQYCATTRIFNAETGFWSVEFVDPAKGNDPGGYWVEFNCQSPGIYLQYPRVYKWADYYKEENLITPGSYEIAVPYWRVTASDIRSFGQAADLKTDGPFTRTLEVVSSIPHTVYAAYNTGQHNVCNAVLGFDVTYRYTAYTFDNVRTAFYGDLSPSTHYEANPDWMTGGLSQFTLEALGQTKTITHNMTNQYETWAIEAGAGSQSYQAIETDATEWGAGTITLKTDTEVSSCQAIPKRVYCYAYPTLGASYDY